MIDISTLPTMADLTRNAARAQPEAPAFIFNNHATSFGLLNERASRVANGLHAAGARPQTRIGYLGMNDARFFEVLFGAFKSGAVMVGINWRLAPPEIAYILKDAEVEILFVAAEFTAMIESLREELPHLRTCIALDQGCTGWDAFDAWRDAQSAADACAAANPDDDAVQLYTSGTTGHPKGVRLTHRNYRALLDQSARAGWGNYQPGDVNLVAMPLFHVAGMNAGIMAVAHGATGIVLRAADPDAVLTAIERWKIRNMFLVPAVIQFILDRGDVTTRDFSSVERVFYGASPISEDVLKRARERFGAEFTQLYGLTETVGCGTFLSPEDHVGARLRSCGKAYPGFGIRVVDQDGQDCVPGVVGEILLKSDCVMKGYWKQPHATASAIVDGWFRTGDAGYFDQDGFLFMHDRVKDMIVSGGENIYPAEVENALMSHPDIADAAVIGVPDSRWGESVKAIVVPQPGAVIESADVISFVRQRLAAYKAPRSVDVIDVLPRNPSGKILRKDLRAPYWAGRDRLVN